LLASRDNGRAMRTLGLALAVAFLFTGHAEARREQTYPYPFSRVWTAAVRMLRVDFESPITEKDKDSGYFLFTYPDAGKQLPGSVEVIKVFENGNESVRVVVKLPAMPTYVEQMMLDRLTRKLGQDYGQPPPQKPAPSNTPAQQGSGASAQDGSDAQHAPAHDAAESKGNGDNHSGDGDAAQHK
jgi:hypothetical protein